MAASGDRWARSRGGCCGPPGTREGRGWFAAGAPLGALVSALLAVLLDALAWARGLARAAGKAAAAPLASLGLVCGRVRRLRGAAARAVAIEAPDPRSAGIAAWFYAWHAEPDDADWGDCLRRFGLARPPVHHLRLVGGPQSGRLARVELDLGAAGPRRRLALVGEGGECLGEGGWEAAHLGGLTLEELVAAAAALPGSRPTGGGRPRPIPAQARISAGHWMAPPHPDATPGGRHD